MSDAVFLRNLISNTVYAEQINSAQIQGQQAAKERAVRIQQETIKEQANVIESAEESAQLDVDRDGQQGQTYDREGRTGKKARDDDSDVEDETQEQEAVSPETRINLVV